MINLIFFGIAKLIPFDVYKFSMWQIFKFTPQRIQSYPRRTHKNHFAVTHLHFFDKTIRDTIIAKKSPTRYVISKLSRTSHLKILSKNYSQNLLWMARYGNFIIEKPCSCSTLYTPDIWNHTHIITLLTLPSILSYAKRKKKKRKSSF